MLPALLAPEKRREFLESRQSMIGSSDAPVVAGLDEYGKDVVDLYYEKARPIPDSELERKSIHLFRGVILEDVGADLYQGLTGRKVRKMGTSRHKEHDWAGTHTDRQILAAAGTDVETTGALEVKAPGVWMFATILDTGLSRAQIAQCQWHLACTGYTWGEWAIVNLEHAEGPLLVVPFERNELVIEQLLERGHKFWTEHVEPRKVPDIRDWMDMPDLEIPQHDPERHFITDPIEVDSYRDLIKAWWDRKHYNDEYDRISEEVQDRMDADKRTKIEVTGLGKINYAHREGQVKTALKKATATRALDWDLVRAAILQRFTADADVEGVTLTNKGIEKMVDAILVSCELDWDQFKYQGTPYRHFQPYPIKTTNPRLEE